MAKFFSTHSFIHSPPFDDDEREQEDAEKESESDDEGDADGVLAVDVQRRRERRQDGAVLRVVHRLLPVGREPLETIWKDQPGDETWEVALERLDRDSRVWTSATQLSHCSES